MSRHVVAGVMAVFALLPSVAHAAGGDEGGAVAARGIPVEGLNDLPLVEAYVKEYRQQFISALDSL